MTAPPAPTPRAPRAFKIDDPAVVAQPQPDPVVSPASATAADDAPPATSFALPGRLDIARGFNWGAILVGAMLGLAGLAASLSFARFISIALERSDWIGWVAFALLAIGGGAAVIIVGREIVGLRRLSRLSGLRARATAALAGQDVGAERTVARQLAALYAERTDLAWGLSRFREHQGDVRDSGELLALADRDLMQPLDIQARRLVLKSSKRVATVTALSPMALVAVGFVAIESLRMMRALATLYGGRPGGLGALRLAKLVVAHVIATGGVALTDDMLGQFLGQDVLRRLSRRLGEGAFNGALTARLGVAAIEVIRPLPFIEATPVRARDIVAELFRKEKVTKPV